MSLLYAVVGSLLRDSGATSDFSHSSIRLLAVLLRLLGDK